MRNAFYALLLCFIFTTTSCALEIYQFINTKGYSMGNTLSVLPGFANPASHGFNDARYISLQYVNRYGIKELSAFAGSFNFSNDYLNSGLYVSRFGFDEYNETLIGANFYKKLADYISFGIRINYLNLHYSNKESSKSLLTADIGTLIRATDNFFISVLAINPFRTELKIHDEKLETPVLLMLGASYQIDDNFLVTSEIKKDISYPVICKMGIEYNPIKELSIRTGMFFKPFTPSFGVGLNIYSFIFDLGFSKHPVLGFRSSCGLQFNF